MMRRLLIVCALFLAVPPAHGQNEYSIDSVGTATVDVAPAFIVFKLELLAAVRPPELVKKADEFEATVRAEIQDRSLKPSQIAFSGPNYTHAEQLGPNASALLRFPAGQYASGEGADVRYAALRNEIIELAAAAKARLLPVEYEAGEPEQVEAAAVARALEMAYPHAKAAADVMNARIVSVGNVTIGTVKWSDNDSPPEDYNVRRITCTATVSAQYVYVPAP